MRKKNSPKPKVLMASKVMAVLAVVFGIGAIWTPFETYRCAITAIVCCFMAMGLWILEEY